MAQGLTMGKKDKKKELLAEIRRWQSYFVTTLIAIVAFTITQYNSISNILLFFSIFGVIILLVLIAILAMKIKKIIDEIGRL